MLHEAGDFQMPFREIHLWLRIVTDFVKVFVGGDPGGQVLPLDSAALRLAIEPGDELFVGRGLEADGGEWTGGQGIGGEGDGPSQDVATGELRHGERLRQRALGWQVRNAMKSDGRAPGGRLCVWVRIDA